jgi:hypothetical protein
MKTRKNLLKILILLILSGSIINGGYIKEKNTIYFTDETTEPEKKEIVKNVDFRTFKIFEEDDDFARDKNNIYYKNKKVENVDVNSFQVEDFYFAKDKNNTFYISNDGLMKIKGFRPEGSYAIVQLFVPALLINKYGIYMAKYENDEIIAKSIKPKEMDMDTLEVVASEESFAVFYLKDKNNVYFINYTAGEQKSIDNNIENEDDVENDNDDFAIQIEKLAGADRDTFETVSVYGKDKNNLYFYNQKIKGINTKTFKLVGSGEFVVKDDKGVYYFVNREMKKLQNADFNTFEEVSKNEYYRDKNGVYYYDEYEGTMTKLKGADPKTFEGISYTLGKDKNAIYKKENRLSGIDPATFEEIDAAFTKDKNNIYYEDVPMKGIDPKTFEPFVNYTHVKDKNGIYHFYLFNDDLVVEKVELSPEIDLKTLQSFENYAEYSKDKNNVYYDFQKIEGADIKTFEPDGYSIGKDKKGVYYKTHKINGIDVNSTEVLENEFYKDKNNIYYRNKKLENFKPENFEVISSSLVGQNEDFYYFTEDENDNTKFFLLENKNVDAETFEVLDEEYTKDKNNVYYKGKILKGADVKTFDIHYNKSDNGYKIKDKNKVYKIVNN